MSVKASENMSQVENVSNEEFEVLISNVLEVKNSCAGNESLAVKMLDTEFTVRGTDSIGDIWNALTESEKNW